MAHRKHVSETLENSLVVVLIVIVMLVVVLYVRGKFREIRCNRELRKVLHERRGEVGGRPREWSFDDNGNFNCVFTVKKDSPAGSGNPE